MDRPRSQFAQRKCFHGFRHIIVPAFITIIFIIIYTFVIQNVFSKETLKSGISGNISRADSAYSVLSDEFCRDDFTDFRSRSDMDSERYLELQKRLNNIRALESVRYLYTAGKADDGTLIYIIDGLDTQAEDFAYPGTAIEAEMIPYIESALAGNTVYTQDIIDTTWGHISTACYPVISDDGSGDIIGALCIEMDMETVYKTIDSGNKRVIVLAAVAAVLTIVILVFIFLVMKKQKEKQNAQNEALRESLVKLSEREIILDALSIDFDSVYICDLVNDTVEIIKENSESYDPKAYSLLGDKVYCYSFRTENFYDNFVEKEYDPDLPEKLGCKNLMEQLSHSSHVTYRFKVKPNPTNHIFMEVKIVPIKVSDSFKVVMGFHYIDEIVEEQERQKTRLEKLLYDAQQNSEIISAIAKIYEIIIYVDLNDFSYRTITVGKFAHCFRGETGYFPDLLEKALEKFIKPEWKDEMRTFLDCKTISDRLTEKDSVTYEHQGTDGEWYRARYIVKKRDENGRATEALYVSRIISDEKKQELELKQRLKESAEEAERANASKTDFLRRMSHDVRTPINGIRGMVEIANYYPNDLQKQKECRDKILDSTGHLLSLVNNILDMNKLESGKITLRDEPFDLVEIMSETDSITEMQAIEHNIKFCCDTDNSKLAHRYLIGSATHLKQIFLNFTSNAVKYNREGGSVTVSCRELSCDETTATVQFTCSDTGIGMSKEFLKHAFEPFTQEENNSAHTKYAGSGLGLSIAKQLIELMNGTLELSSKEGVGTTIRFTIPFRIDPAPCLKTEEELPTGLRLNGTKALLAEDNDLNAEIAKFLLGKYGIEVTWACNGEQAVEFFRTSAENEFDVIFMDVMMPVMNGLDAAEHIRALDRKDAKTVPIFAMTANAFTDDIQRSYDAGMNEHLTKPLQESEIIRTLQKYIKSDKR